jgi:FMN-dependent oxidoreductase (nitrilotriacetate monooxygenase family)
MPTSPKIHLFVSLSEHGHHESAWRMPDADPRAAHSAAHFQHVARLAEAAKFDAFFLSEGLAVWGEVDQGPTTRLEPTVLLATVGAVTERLGLIGTSSTTFADPFTLARRFASLDHLTDGRAGWNIVTTADDRAAANFNADHLPPHARRYQRATEFVEVVQKLWDSWDDDAVIVDKKRGIYANPDQVRTIDHEGEFFRVRGPLNVIRPPQGRPVLVQAGASEDGRTFAARFAEVIFTAQPSLPEALEFASDMRRRISDAGRDPSAVRIIPGLAPIIGLTEREAQDREAQVQGLIVERYALRRLSRWLHVATEDWDLDRPLPDDLPTEHDVNGMKARFSLIVDWAQRENLTVRQLLGALAGAHGHRTFAGTPAQLADTIQEWVEAGAADGFVIQPQVLPTEFELFTAHVVPELQRRGLFRTEYSGPTLRHHLGLERPDLYGRSQNSQVPHVSGQLVGT